MEQLNPNLQAEMASVALAIEQSAKTFDALGQPGVASVQRTTVTLIGLVISGLSFGEAMNALESQDFSSIEAAENKVASEIAIRDFPI